MGELTLPKDTFVLPGGADINPALYGNPNWKSYFHDYTDNIQIAGYKKAVEEGRPIFGICRGMQLMSALNGLKLIQDVDHPSSHMLRVRDLTTGKFNKKSHIRVNSCHHQLVWTENNLRGKNYVVYGYTNISPHHDYLPNEKITCTIEPEIIWFPEIKGLAVQWHPEWLDKCEAITYLQQLIDKLLV